jgi:hypothetical protein
VPRIAVEDIMNDGWLFARREGAPFHGRLQAIKDIKG